MASETGLEMAPAANAVREAGSLPNWFIDRTNSREHQASYLAKIYRQRDNLFKEEHGNMKTAVERVSTRGGAQTKPKAPLTVKWRPGMGVPSQTMTPRDRHLEKIRSRRQRPLPPVIHPIEGRPLLEIPSPRRANSEPNVAIARKNSFMDAFLNNSSTEPGASVQTTPRYSESNNKTAVSSLMKSISTPSASIPTIGRRARPTPAEQLSGFTVKKAEPSSESENKPKGKLYKFSDRLGMKRLVKPDSDELDLTPETYRFDLPYEDELTRFYRKGERLVPPPNTTPVSFNDLNGRELDDAIIKQVKWSNDVVLLHKTREAYRHVIPVHEQVQPRGSPQHERKKTPKSSGSCVNGANVKLPQINNNPLTPWQVDELVQDQAPNIDYTVLCTNDRNSNNSSKGSSTRKQIHIDMPSFAADPVSPIPQNDAKKGNIFKQTELAE